MTYKILATGSTGNAVILSDRILIDIGVPYKLIKPFGKKLQLVLLTHQHKDHFNPATAAALHKERPALRLGCCEWMLDKVLDAGIDRRVIDLIVPGRAYSYGKTVIAAEEVPHDVRNCAWRLLFLGREYDESVFYLTDCSTLDGIEAKGYDLYMIEANHKRAEIEQKIAEKKAAGLYAYEAAAMRNHLSQEQALDWLAEQMGPESEYIFLHQHKAKEK